MSRSTNFLDADESILGQNLKFVRDEAEEELRQFFGGASSSSNSAGGTGASAAPPRDFKVVTPKPGFCLKSFKVNTNEKYFINICQTDEIPSPEDITEAELTRILQSDAPSAFRIPMSISEPRITKDKSNNPVDACDIAINPQFFAKIEKSALFKDFFVALIAEALSDKYNVQIKIDKSVILNNRKFIGTLVAHRVRNNDVKTVLKSYKNPTEADAKKLAQLEQSTSNSSGGIPSRRTTPLVQEIDASEVNVLKQKTQQLTASASKINIKQEIALAASTVPEFKLRAKLCAAGEAQVEELQAEFHLPKCISAQEVTLDIGEDRIQLESMKHGYLFDKFVNYRMDQERAKAIFDKTNKMLQVRIPVYPVQ